MLTTLCELFDDFYCIVTTVEAGLSRGCGYWTHDVLLCLFGVEKHTGPSHPKMPETAFSCRRDFDIVKISCMLFPEPSDWSRKELIRPVV